MAAMVLSGCASTVYIDSEPEGATVTIDGKHVGETPTKFTSTATSFTSHHVRIEKEGYRTTTATLRRDGDINPGALIAGIFGITGCFPFLAGWLWITDYPRSVHYQLRADEREYFVRQEAKVEGGEVTFVLIPEDAVISTAY